MKIILTTGDWVADWNLARPENLPEGYFDGSLETQLHHRAGGAWYLAHLINTVTCRDLKDTLRVEPVRPSAESIHGLTDDGAQRDDIAHAYSVWWKHKRLESGKDDDLVWRIARFAGCRKSTTWAPPTTPPAEGLADLLVTDDLGLGFSERPEVVDHTHPTSPTEAKFSSNTAFAPTTVGSCPFC